MFYKKINILILLSLLTGCSVNYNYPEVQKATVEENYGIWEINGCTLQSQRADITVKLTDIYKNEAIRITIESSKNLKNTPKVNIIGLEGYDFELTGTGKFYSIEVPTTIIDQARMHLDEAFLQVYYQVDGKDYFTAAIFPLQKLPKAMLDIKKDCN
jgi:hypothetical protein